MRVIKFRAWDLDNFNMHYSDRQGEGDGAIAFILGLDGVHFEELQLIDRLVGGEHEQTEEYRTPKQVVMQFTGLQDKNGKEIYEGDIIETHHPLMRGEVVFQEGMFLLTGGQWGQRVRALADRYAHGVIVGNIHESPDLLPTP